MNKDLLELLEKRNALQAKVSNAKNMAELTELQKEADEINEKINVIVQRNKLANDLNNNPGLGLEIPTSKNPSPVIDDKYDSMEYRSAFMEYVLSHGKKDIPAEYRTANTSTSLTTDVGAVIPTTVLNRIVSKIETSGNIISEVTRTMYKGGVSIPVAQVKPVAKWVNEAEPNNGEKQTTDEITFSYHKLICKVRVSLEVSVMAISAFENFLVEAIAEAIVIALEKAIISGTGVGQPKGIVTEKAVENQTITVDKAKGLTFDDIIAAEAALPLAYEAGAVYVMTKKTFMTFQGQKDKNDRPIATSSVGPDGKEKRYLYNRPVECTDFLPTLTSQTPINTVVGFIFRLKDYDLNTSYTTGLRKYTDEESDDEIMKSITIADGKVVDKNSLVLLKTAAV